LPTTTAPRFTIDGTTFELGFAHRWSFRISTRRVADFNGGVVEVTTDKGKTWTDISEYGTVDCNTTLDEGRGDNVLEGRRAYGNKSKGYPDQWVASRIKVDLKAHPEVVQIRFRHASGTGSRGLQAGRSTRSISAGSRTHRSGRSSRTQTSAIRRGRASSGPIRSFRGRRWRMQLGPHRRGAVARAVCSGSLSAGPAAGLRPALGS
jgi:hypothetical protein